MEPTKRPWDIETIPNMPGEEYQVFAGELRYVSDGLIDDEDPCSVFNETEAPSLIDAELIVRAVNSHDSLVAACERFVEDYDSGMWTPTDFENGVTQARAALAAAKEKADERQKPNNGG